MRNWINLFEDVEIDPSDYMKPRLMAEPIVLYRSVSIPELIDIMRTNRVLGGRNTFNGFDHRKWVFFGDNINEVLIYQGEEIDRKAGHAMKDNAVTRQFKGIIDNIAEYAAIVVAMLKRQGVEMQDNYTDAFLQDGRNWRYMLNLSNQVRKDQGARATIAANCHKIRESLAEVDEIQKRWREVHARKMGEITAHLATKKFSSAVIETRLLDGGAHYSKKWGSAGLGDHDEYGFDSGDVTFNDVTRVHMVKDGKIVMVLDAEEAERRIEWIEEAGIEE